jgi:phosphohistidine phosphatase
MATELYLIRHGIAGDRSQFSTDIERPLTQAGIQKTQAIAKRLAQLNLRFDLIQTSPLVRARQTADILKQAKLSAQLLESPHLAPGGDLLAWVTWLEDWRRANPNQQSLAIVGHEPDLGEWAEQLLWGEAKQRLVVKKAGVIGVLLPDHGSVVANSHLFWLAPPRLLL